MHLVAMFDQVLGPLAGIRGDITVMHSKLHKGYNNYYHYWEVVLTGIQFGAIRIMTY